jgi:hypothetical protein
VANEGGLNLQGSWSFGGYGSGRPDSHDVVIGGAITQGWGHSFSDPSRQDGEVEGGRPDGLDEQLNPRGENFTSSTRSGMWFGAPKFWSIWLAETPGSFATDSV